MPGSPRMRVLGNSRKYKKALLRVIREVAKFPRIWHLNRTNRRSSECITGNAPVVVSLTTHGRRIRDVHLTIESIAAGRRRPSELILWLDRPDDIANLPSEIIRLKARGLRVEIAENLGPHTKYFPALDGCIRQDVPLVTADDDILYPTSWLEKLLIAAGRHPEDVTCYKSRRVLIRNGDFAPYQQWPENWSTQPSPVVFALGVSGVFYPVRMLKELARRGREFVDCCPRADDIWLHYVALTAGVAVRQLDRAPVHFASVPNEGEALSIGNVALGGNDSQIVATYDPVTIERMAAVRDDVRG